MPIIDQKDVSPDEAILLGHCPECGQALIPKTAVAHATSKHWGNDPNDPKLSEEARRRYKLVIDFAAARYNPALEERDPRRRRKGMPSPSQIEPSVPQHDTRPFWIDPVIAAVLFAQGLNMLFSEQRVWGLPSWLFGAVLSAAGAGWLWYHRTERAAMTADRRVPNAWALALIVVATIVTGYDFYDRYSHPRQNQVPTIVAIPPIQLGWGAETMDCVSDINGPVLMIWSKRYDVAIVCGLNDATRDKFTDTRITVSPVFSIHPQTIPISIPFSADLKAAVKAAADAAHAPQGSLVGVSLWVEAVLLPKNTNVSDIHRLSDVPRYEGVLLSQGFPPLDANPNAN